MQACGVRAGFAASQHPQVQAALQTIKAATLLLVPRLDVYNPVDDAVAAATLIPNATLVRLESDAGHAVAADTSPQLADVAWRSANS